METKTLSITAPSYLSNPMKRPPGKKHRDETRSDDRRTQWKFGQNFLVDESVIRGICDDVPSSPADWIIEIGPGQGALTRRLAQRCRKLTALEIDTKWVEHLRAHPAWGPLEVIQTDATRVDWAEILETQAPEPGVKPIIVGNLPYNRAAPILFNLLPHLHRCISAQVMLQYEVAKRICANPHSRDFGFFTVMVQNRAQTELLRKVSPEAFRPKPKIWSATVRLTPRLEPGCNDPLFQPFVDLAFSQKRKQMANSLEPLYKKETVTQALIELELRTDSRAEDLSAENFASLFAKLGPIQKDKSLDLPGA